MATRKEVYSVIDNEREYQSQYQARFQHQNHASVAEEILLMETYLQNARLAWASVKEDSRALHELRKVVSIGVRCFENHGIPDRIEGAVFADMHL